VLDPCGESREAFDLHLVGPPASSKRKPIPLLERAGVAPQLLERQPALPWIQPLPVKRPATDARLTAQPSPSAPSPGSSVSNQLIGNLPFALHHVAALARPRPSANPSGHWADGRPTAAPLPQALRMGSRPR
jgi:hypothetical protein